MQVQNINYQNTKSYAPQFKGNMAKLWLTPIKNTKVGKDLTELDKYAFQTYVNSKQFHVGITQEEINKLSKFDGEEFFTASFDYLTQKLGIKKSIQPTLVFTQLPDDSRMAYTPINNSVMVNLEKCSAENKAHQFAGIRHELQHFLQSSMILRHEELGQKAIDSMVAVHENSLVDIFKHLMTEASEEEISAVAKTTSNPEGFIKMIFEALTGNSDKIVKEISDSSNEFEKSLNTFRKSLIKDMGRIPKDSALTPRIEEYYKGFSNSYHNADGSIDISKYVNTSTEEEAMLAETCVGKEFENPKACLLKQIKDDLLDEIIIQDANS